MRELDMFEEILDEGKKRGTLTYEEINEALPSEFFPPDELEGFVGLLQDMGVNIVGCEDQDQTARPGMREWKIWSRRTFVRWAISRS
jgi:hypothetical protein